MENNEKMEKQKQIKNLETKYNKLHENISQLHASVQKAYVQVDTDKKDYSNVYGNSLSKSLSNNKFIDDIFHGINFLHKMGWGHFDIKPDNIMLHFQSILSPRLSQINNIFRNTVTAKSKKNEPCRCGENTVRIIGG